MSVEVSDNREESRYEVREDGALAAFATYELRGDVVALLHTEALPGFEGRGLAGRLVAGALDDARTRGLGVLPFCPYVRRVIGKDRDRYLDLVPLAERERFDLA